MKRQEPNLSKDSVKSGYFEALCDSLDGRFSIGTIEKYAKSPLIFAREIIHVAPTTHQSELLKAVGKRNHVAARSGHGVGKSAVLSWLGLWFICCHPYSKVICSAPTATQLGDVLWREISRWFRQMDKTFSQKFELTSEKLYHRQHPLEWYIAARVARKETPEALQGHHGDHLAFLLDEASGIDDMIFEVSESSLTAPNNLCVLAGNPLRRHGFFYRAFHDDRDGWETLHFSSEDSPRVSREHIERMEKKYGRDSSIFRVRVLGEFPLADDDSLIPLHLLEAAVQNTTASLEGHEVWALDPARYGADESALCKRTGDVITELKGVRGLDTMSLCGWLINEIVGAKRKPDVICIDEIGLGAGVVDRLLELGYPVQAVNVATSPQDGQRYSNLRAELWCRLSDAVREERIKLPDDAELIGQASTIRYKFDSSGRILIEKKEDMKRRGLHSPDRADAVCLTFAHHGESSGFFSVGGVGAEMSSRAFYGF